jgi:hypothetical protein
MSGRSGLVDEQVALALDVVQRVLGEALELVAHVQAGHLEHLAEGVQVLARSPGHLRPVHQDRVTGDGDHLPVDHLVHDLGADAVEHGTPAPGSSSGPELG